MTTPGIREELIKKAIEFLTAPNVLKAEDSKKRKFLKSKGLTDQEIEEAYKRTGQTYTPTPATPATNYNPNSVGVPATTPGPPQMVHPPPLPPRIIYAQPPLVIPWQRLYLMFLLFGGISAGLIYIIKKYILTMVFPKKKENEIEELRDIVNGLSTNVLNNCQEINTALKGISNHVKGANKNIETQKYFLQYKEKQEGSQIKTINTELKDMKQLIPTLTTLQKNALKTQQLEKEVEKLEKEVNQMRIQPQQPQFLSPIQSHIQPENQTPSQPLVQSLPSSSLHNSSQTLNQSQPPTQPLVQSQPPTQSAIQSQPPPQIQSQSLPPIQYQSQPQFLSTIQSQIQPEIQTPSQTPTQPQIQN